MYKRESTVNYSWNLYIQSQEIQNVDGKLPFHWDISLETPDSYDHPVKLIYGFVYKGTFTLEKSTNTV